MCGHALRTAETSSEMPTLAMWVRMAGVWYMDFVFIAAGQGGSGAEGVRSKRWRAVGLATLAVGGADVAAVAVSSDASRKSNQEPRSTIRS